MTAALDVAIGVVFLYLLLALMVTTIQELIASVLGLRAKNLYKAIDGMLNLLVPIGWLITMLAVSLGAAFWFDVLGKALQLRGTGPKVSVATGRVE